MYKLDCILLRGIKDFRIGIKIFGYSTKFIDCHIGFLSIYFSQLEAE
jgi:hypothetical protein